MIKPIPDKGEWPKTVDGTTDWEALFENKDTGLIAIIYATETPAQLKQQTEAIIRAVFSRKRDQALLGKLSAFLDKLIPDDAGEERLPTLQAGVRQLLQRIKENRINRAVAYAAKRGRRKNSKSKTNRRANIVIGFFRRCTDALVIVFALFKKTPKTQKSAKNEDREKLEPTADKDTFFQQEAYVGDGDGDGNTEWQDDDMYAIKESETAKPGAFDDIVEEKKDDDKYESWDDY